MQERQPTEGMDSPEQGLQRQKVYIGGLMQGHSGGENLEGTLAVSGSVT